MKGSTKMDIEHCNLIKDSIYSLEEAIGNASPIIQPASYSFKPKAPFPPPPFHHARNSSESMSIEEEMDGFVTHTKKYKCFKCYGVHSPQNNNFSTPLCEQCDGTEYISETHPLATLFDKVMKVKLPSLLQKVEEVSSITIIDPMTECTNCREEVQTEHAFFCDTCHELSLCQSCFTGKKYFHNASHHFSKKLIKNQMLKLKQNLPTMKKISQEFQSEQGCGGEVLVCSYCGVQIEQCFQSCLDCEMEGKKYLICDSCTEIGRYNHDIRHNFTVRMANKESKMPGPASRQSEVNVTSLDYDAEDFQVSSNSKSNNIHSRSIVYIPHIQPDTCDDIQQSQIRLSPLRGGPNRMESSQTESLVFDQPHPCNPESVQTSSKKEGEKGGRTNKSRLRNQSLIKINMEESDEISMDQILQRQFKITTSQTAEEEQPEDQFFPKVKIHDISQPPQDFLFTDYECDICRISPIRNKRYHCKDCQNFDICQDCFLERISEHYHLNYEQIDGQRQREERRCKVIEQTQRYSFGSLKNIDRKSIQR